MKVLYDHQVFEFQNIGGISRYFIELIKYNPYAKLSLRYSDNIYLKNEDFSYLNILPKNYERNRIFPNFNFKGKGRLLNYYIKFSKKNNISVTKQYIRNCNYDIFHPTYYNPYFLNYLKKTFVLTVYDMIHELFPQYFTNDKNIYHNKNILINKANKIITISENTKNDLLRIHNFLKPEDIDVVYLGSSFPNISIPLKKENYILFTGARDDYKNFENLIKAIAELLNKYNLKLICTGNVFNNKEKELFKKYDISDRVLQILSTDNQLIDLYTKAIAFIFPSLYEGFGIPVLEAFSRCCPALLSNTSSLPEIGGDAAVYFDPYSIDDMRNQIEKVICSESMQNELIKKGTERVKLFSWEKCAKETMEVYKKLA